MDFDTFLSEYEKTKKEYEKNKKKAKEIKRIKAILSGEREREILHAIDEQVELFQHLPYSFSQVEADRMEAPFFRKVAELEQELKKVREEKVLLQKFLKSRNMQ